MSGEPRPLPLDEALYEDIGNLVQNLGWSEHDLAEIDPEGVLRQSGALLAKKASAPSNNTFEPQQPPVVWSAAPQQPAALQPPPFGYGLLADTNASAPRPSFSLLGAHVPSPLNSPSSAPLNRRRRSSVASANDSPVRQSLEELHTFDSQMLSGGAYANDAAVRQSLEVFRPFDPPMALAQTQLASHLQGPFDSHLASHVQAQLQMLQNQQMLNEMLLLHSSVPSVTSPHAGAHAQTSPLSPHYQNAAFQSAHPHAFQGAHSHVFQSAHPHLHLASPLPGSGRASPSAQQQLQAQQLPVQQSYAAPRPSLHASAYVQPLQPQPHCQGTVLQSAHPHSHLASPMPGSGRTSPGAQLLQRPSPHSRMPSGSTPSSSYTPSDCSDQTAQAAGTFFWERCAVSHLQIRRTAEAPAALSSPAQSGVSITDICLVRPFMRSQSMLHYWFRTWKVPRVTISVANARAAGPGCSVCLQAITVSAGDTMAAVELRGTTRVSLVGGQATFSGLMFGTTSYAHTNSLFHLLATIECEGEVVDARISTGLHIFSKNKQTNKQPTGVQGGRPRTGSQLLETSRTASGSRGGSVQEGSAQEDDDALSPLAHFPHFGGFQGGYNSAGALLSPLFCPSGLDAPSRTQPDSPMGCAHSDSPSKRRSPGASAHGGLDEKGLSLLEPPKRQRSGSHSGSGLVKGQDSPMMLREGSPLGVHRAPSITVGMEETEDEPLDCTIASRRNSASGQVMRPTFSEPRSYGRSPLAEAPTSAHPNSSHALPTDPNDPDSALLLGGRARRISASGTSPLCARVVTAGGQSTPLAQTNAQTNVQSNEFAQANGQTGARRPEPLSLRCLAKNGNAIELPEVRRTFELAEALPEWLLEPNCNCLVGSKVFALALHVAPAQLGAALGAELAAPTLPPPAPTPPPPAAAQRPPAASPPSLFIAYASTNLDASFGGGGSLSGATGMLLSALFETDDFALLCAALHRLCPDISLLPPARPISPPAVPPSAAPPVKGFGGGSVDLGERRLRASGLPGQYAGLRVHCVLLCTPAPLATPDGSPSARAHVSLLCRALSAAEGANGAAGAPPLADGALAVLSECGDVIVRLDNKLRVAYVSDAVDELTGYAAHELLGLALSEAGWLLHADDAEQLRAAALDPAHSLAAAAQRAAVLQGRRRPAPVRTRALARLGCKFSTELSLVEMVLTHSFAPAAAETSGALPPCLEAITVCIRERAGAAPAHLFGAPAEPRPAIIAFAGMDIE